MRFIITALLPVLLGVSSVSAQSDKARSQDLLFLIGTSLAVPGIAAYCEKYIEKNPGLIAAAQRWNQRHQKVQELIIDGIKRAGGLSVEQKRKFDSEAFQLLKKEIEGERDKVAYCRDAARIIDAGDMDFSKRPDTAAALSRLGMVAP
jgi:hypothetical protein